MSVEPYYCAEGVALYLGDCIEVMRALPEASVDAVVCDPPYGLEFMGKEWDAPWKANGFRRAENEADVGRDDPFGRTSRTSPEYRAGREFQQWCEAWAREAYRVLKPGAHLLAFGGTRTHHRLVCGIEDAGFEIRDELDWMFGSGFPKSLDVSKAIDKQAGAEREVIGKREVTRDLTRNGRTGDEAISPIAVVGATLDITAPATEDAQRWQGWGTALKPAHEPICLARKPLAGTVAANVLRHGTGALNIDGTRVGNPEDKRAAGSRSYQRAEPGGRGQAEYQLAPHDGLGRWPANVLLDEEAAALLDATAGERGAFAAASGATRTGESTSNSRGRFAGVDAPAPFYADRGGPSRFYFTAKASRSEREAGLDELPPALRTDGRPPEGPGADNPRLRVSERHNDHPTVKPIAVMRWLVRLITPPGGVVLDPFLGSGTTALAALDERMRFIGIDITERYLEIARYRVSHRHLLEVETKPSTETLPQGRLL